MNQHIWRVQLVGGTAQEETEGTEEDMEKGMELPGLNAGKAGRKGGKKERRRLVAYS